MSNSIGTTQSININSINSINISTNHWRSKRFGMNLAKRQGSAIQLPDIQLLQKFLRTELNKMYCTIINSFTGFRNNFTCETDIHAFQKMKIPVTRDRFVCALPYHMHFRLNTTAMMKWHDISFQLSIPQKWVLRVRRRTKRKYDAAEYWRAYYRYISRN